jgi:hypothetical protein
MLAGYEPVISERSEEIPKTITKQTGWLAKRELGPVIRRGFPKLSAF